MTRTLMRLRRLILVTICLLLPAARDLAAQVRDPVGPLAADVRVALPRFKEDANVASALGVSSNNLPGRGLGLAGGVHWYPLRGRRVTLGIGGEMLVSSGSRTLEAPDETSADGPTVNTRFSSIAPQLSLNFGSGRGWSYVSAGLGWGSFTTERADAQVADAVSRPRVLNYGGGARWFAKEHVAFTFDVRFYAVSAQEAGTARPAYPQMRFLVVSAGASFK